MPDPDIFNADGRFNAFAAKPTPGNGAGLGVIYKIFSVSNAMRSLCDYYYDEERFIAMCPDTSWKVGPYIQLMNQSEKDWTQGFKLIESLLPNFDKIVANVNTIIVYVCQMNDRSNKPVVSDTACVKVKFVL